MCNAKDGIPATFLTNKGKLIAHLTVFDDGEQTLLETESNCVDALLGGLSRYIISEDVTLEHLREEASFSVEGLGASKLLALVSGASFEELDALPHLGIIRTGRSRTGPTEDVRITARRFDPSPRFDIAASEAIAIDLLTTLRDNGATAASAELARTRRIESGRPEFGVDMDDSHLPLEASLNEAVNFEKGCYIGQEYVVRLAHRGHLNRKLVGLRIDSETPLPSGLKLTSGDSEAGELTSSAYSPTLGATVALGYVKRDFFEPGTVLQVQGDIDATVTELPLLKQDSAQTD